MNGNRAREPTGPAQAARAEGRGSDGAIRILLVEDEPAHVELIERAFERPPGRFRLTVAGSIVAARAALREAPPDLVIADWRLPDGDGLDLVRGREGRAGVPVVLMTSHGSERVAVDAMHAGVLDYVVKSVDALADLPHTAARALQEWRHRLERERMLEALRASEEQYRLVADHVADALWTMDLRMRLTFVTPSAERMYGWTVEEMLALQPEDYMPPRALALARAKLADVLASRGRPEDDTVTLELEQRRKDGTAFWGEVKAQLLRDGRETPTGIIGSTRDITDRKRLEQQLLQARRLESIGKLAGGVAHDFNNILAVIVGYGEILRMSQREDDPDQECVSGILESAERAARLTRGLLAFSRRQVIAPRNVDLRTCVHDVQKLLVRIMGEDVELATELDPDPLVVHADVSQLEQVLMNLATNARDAMPKGGRFTIAAARTVLDEEYVRAKGQGTPGPHAMLVVRDTGVGMDEETQAQMFDPFFTTKEPGKGTGLGLATVYGIVTQNGGHIDVSSGIGEGTTLRIFLPLVDDPPAPDLPSGPTQAIRGGEETILLAEDDAAVRKLRARVLRKHGYTVLEAADGEEALRAFLQGGDRIRLAVLDVIMPKRNGREVLEALRRSHPALKAIFTSGYSADLIQREGVLEEGLDFLPKPSTPQELLRKVRDVLDR